MSSTEPQWKVTTVTPSQGRDQTNAFVPGWTVTYQLAGGATGQVFVPKTVSDPDAIRQVVAADAATVNTIANLQSG